MYILHNSRSQSTFMTNTSIIFFYLSRLCSYSLDQVVWGVVAASKHNICLVISCLPPRYMSRWCVVLLLTWFPFLFCVCWETHLVRGHRRTVVHSHLPSLILYLYYILEPIYSNLLSDTLDEFHDSPLASLSFFRLWIQASGKITYRSLYYNMYESEDTQQYTYA